MGSGRRVASAALAGNTDAAHEIRAFAQRAIDNAGRRRTPPDHNRAVGLGLHAHAAPDHNRRPPDRGIDLGL